MDQMQLDAEQRNAAIKLFNEGKKSDFPLDDILVQFKQVRLFGGLCAPRVLRGLLPCGGAQKPLNQTQVSLCLCSMNVTGATASRGFGSASRRVTFPFPCTGCLPGLRPLLHHLRSPLC